MNLRWLVFDYVDPELPLSRAERRRLRRRGLASGGDMAKIHGTGWPMYLTALIPGMCMLISMAIFFLFFRSSIVGIVLVLLLQGLLTWLALAFVGRFTWRRQMCAELRSMGHEVCPGCGYWLRGLPPNALCCPECGAQREGMPS